MKVVVHPEPLLFYHRIYREWRFERCKTERHLQARDVEGCFETTDDKYSFFDLNLNTTRNVSVCNVVVFFK